MVVGKQVKDCWGKNEGVERMKKGENGFSPSYFFPKSSVIIFFPQQPFFPLMDHEMPRQYTIINKSVPYINRKNHSPFFLFPFSFLCILLLNASFLFFFPGTIPPRSSHSYFTKYIPLNIYFCLYIFGLKYEFYLSLLQ